MEPLIQHIIEKNQVIPILAISLGCLIAMIAMITTTVRAIAVGRAREQTKRELAAYVAEGSLDPDKAVAMINAGRKAGETGGKSCC